MAFEIEKKFKVLDYDAVYGLLKKEFQQLGTFVKAGFWWTNKCDALASVLESGSYFIPKKEIQTINHLAEIKIPEENFQYLRLRIVNNNQYFITLKNKSLVNKVEQNVEYEYECEKGIFKNIVNFLSQNFSIFYYNVKNTVLFQSKDVLIELSTFNDLEDPYLEIEVVGENQEKLASKLEEALCCFDRYPMKEEPESYHQLSKKENLVALKNKKWKDYSKEALSKLQNMI